MLMKCPECELQVSDKAISCPHCGYPLSSKVKAPVRKSRRRKRLPNGFGQISEIKGRNLRKPFRVLVTTGKEENGKLIVKPLKPDSYFATYNEAYQALVDYNRNPYDLEESITVGELFERWLPEYRKKAKGETTLFNTMTAWKYCSSVRNMRVVDIRQRHIKGCMEQGTIEVNGEKRNATLATQYRIKTLFNQMLDYALEYNLVEKNYARTFTPTKEIMDAVNKPKKGHINFTDEEMLILWNASTENRYASMAIIQCYSGWRPQELCMLKIENVDLEHSTFLGGMKTEAGENRTVPIHSKIKDLVRSWYNTAIETGSEYLFTYRHARSYDQIRVMSYDVYRRRFKDMLQKYNISTEHSPHDCRVQFVSMAKKYNLDEYAIKYIVGHAISDITEKTYTKRDASWLAQEIEKIK